MNTKSYVVLGEAPESDSDDEIDFSIKVSENLKQCQGKIIGGEAPESDQESNDDTGSIESVCSALSASSSTSLTGSKAVYTKKNSSLLQKKLRERNSSLRKNVKEFVSHTITSAGSDLNSTNQQLLKCQIQLQEAADILKTINTTLTHLDNYMQCFLSTPFLPDIVFNNKAETTGCSVPASYGPQS